MNRRPLILISLLLAAFVINLDTTIVNVALPSIQQPWPPSAERTERLLARPPEPIRMRRWKCPSAKARRYASSRW